MSEVFSDKLMAHEGRISALESLIKSYKEDMENIEAKLDQLLTLKNKGAGAFWLVTIIASSGVLGILGTIFDWFKTIKQ